MTDVGKGRLVLRSALAEAWRRWPTMWKGAPGPLVLAMLFALSLTVGPTAGGARAVLWVGLMLALLVAFGALTRIGVARDLAGARALGLGPFGFQFSKAEARLAGATALCWLFLSIMLSLLALVALALFGAAGLDAEAVRARDWAAVGPMWKLILLAFVGLIVLGAPVVLIVRLSLYAPATVGRGRMISLTATGLTNGAMIPLFAGLVVTSLPWLVWAFLTTVGMLSGAGGLVLGILAWLGLQAPLSAAFLGTAYRRLETDAARGT